MALQPSARPAGSSQVLRFSGLITLGSFASTAYPKANGELPSNAAANTLIGVRFLLADATDPTDTTTTLPTDAYDDNDPAAAAPHSPTLGCTYLNGTDLNISDRTWCQNTYVTVVPRTVAAAALLGAVDTAGVEVVLDSGASSGLGLNTGLPVIVIPMAFTTVSQFPGCDVDILVEVRHSASR